MRHKYSNTTEIGTSDFFGLHENMEIWNHADEFNLTFELKIYYCKTWEIM